MSLVGLYSAIWPIVCCEPLAPATGSCLCPHLVSEQFTAFTVIFTNPILHGLKDKSGFFQFRYTFGYIFGATINTYEVFIKFMGARKTQCVNVS